MKFNLKGRILEVYKSGLGGYVASWHDNRETFRKSRQLCFLRADLERLGAKEIKK